MSKDLPQLSCYIKKFSKKGHGVALVEKGDTVKEMEVPYTIPGEKVCVELPRKRRQRTWRRHVVAVEEPSDSRIEPKCVHFGDCGGCRWQHMDYSSQLKWKQERVFSKFSEELNLERTRFDPIVASPKLWEYRNKMEFSFHQDREGNNYLGLHRFEGRHIVDLQECHLVDPLCSELLQVVRKWWKTVDCLAYFPPKDKGSLRSLTVRRGIVTGDMMVILTVSGNPEFALKRQELDLFVELLEEAFKHKVPSLSIVLQIQQARVGEPTQFYEMILAGPDTLRERLTVCVKGKEKSYTCLISPTAFFQPNTLQAQYVYEQALKVADLSKHDKVLDLFCGTGTIGMCASAFVDSVIGIELHKSSVYDAIENIKENAIENMEVIQGDAAIILRNLLSTQRVCKNTVVFVDPPRSGLGKECLKILCEYDFSKIIYISCNPETQLQDLKALQNLKGYSIESLSPVDQFPYTPHLENIALLKKL